jgi:hypothetical protein
MTDGSVTPTLPPFGIGSTFTTTLIAIGRSLVPLIVVLLVVDAVKFAIIVQLFERWGPLHPWTSLGLIAMNTMADALVSAYMAGLALTALEQGRADMRFALTRTPLVFLSLTPLTLIYSAAARYGIPGAPPFTGAAIAVVLALITWVYVSVLVREGGNPWGALKRNLALTAGWRLRILAVILIILVTTFIISVALNLTLRPMMMSFGTAGYLRAAVALQLAITDSVNTFTYMLGVASYCMLRAEKDGPAQDAVAKVFE